MYDKQLVLTISSQTLIATQVVDYPPYDILKTQEYSWTVENITQILQEISADFGHNKVRVMLKEDLAWAVSLAVPKDAIGSREKIEKYLQFYIPEALDSVVWDYKHHPSFIVDDFDGMKQVVQVIGCKKVFVDLLNKAVMGTGLEVEVIEPISVSIGRLLKPETEPLALIYNSDTVLRSVIYQGLVIMSQVMDSVDYSQHLNQLINFSKEHFSIKPTRLILSGDVDTIDVNAFAHYSLVVQKMNLNPVVGIIQKKMLTGKDEDVLNIELENKNTSVSTKSSKEDEEAMEVDWLKVFMVALISCLLVVGFLGGWYFLSKGPSSVDSTKVAQAQLSPTIVVPTIVVAPTASVSAVKRDDVKIEVQNGSGISGKAGEMSSVLSKLGYKNLGTGNADNYDYVGVTIKSKQKDVFTLLQEDLESKDFKVNDYDEKNVLKKDYKYDAVVIYGK